MTKEDLAYFEQYPDEKIFIKVGESYFTEKQLVAAKVYASTSNKALKVLEKEVEVVKTKKTNKK